MQATKRYTLLGLSIALLFIFWMTVSPTRWNIKDHSLLTNKIPVLPSSSFSDLRDALADVDLHISPRRRREVAAIVKKRTLCRMETCFDIEKCRALPEYKVFVYPIQDRLSTSYGKILSTIQESRYFTSDPNLACLYILAIDTLDRDIRSPDFLKNLQSRVNSLSTWNNGRNHLIFNLYSGTWPEYNEDLGFDFGEAILAKASFSVANFRHGFDISLPLFPKDHPLKGGDLGVSNSAALTISPLFPAIRKYTLVFKGKRYLTGIGSETRNSLYHLHNGNDVILLTTCRHGKGWKEVKDERCDIDNSQYDKFDYQVLLHNSTFCLVPRGRRLGSFRFLEALQAGCIPVLLSNGWVLPFSEIIDWNKASIWADERLLFQVPSIVRSLSPNRILALRQQTLFLWEAYFSSIEKITLTSLEIVKDRIFRQTAHQKTQWNLHPGGLHILPDFSEDIKAFPFYHQHIHQHESPLSVSGLTLANSLSVLPQPAPLSSLFPQSSRFTAIVFARSTHTLLTVGKQNIPVGNSPPQMIDPRSVLYKLLKNIQASKYCEKILILWPGNRSPRLPSSPVPIVVINEVKSVNSRFYPYAHLQTDALLSLDEDVNLTTEEIDFSFLVWQEFPSQIVGFPQRNHYWEEHRSRWAFTSKWTNHYSMILTHAAFYHRYFNYLYTHSLRAAHLDIVESSQSCEDILMNFLVSHVTRFPPIKVAQRKTVKDLSGMSASSEASFSVRQACLNDFIQSFGYMPLIRSSMRLDPVLFKDPVSNLRKKYRKLELMGP